MYFSHCLHHCIFNIQMLSHSRELERRAVHATIQRSLVWTNYWQYSVISLFCELLSSRWSCRMNSLETKLPSCWKVCEMVMHTCSKHMTIFAEEQVWLLYFVLVYIVCHFCRPVFILCLWVDAKMKLLQYSHSKCNRKWTSQYAVHTVICATVLCILLFLCAYFRFCGDPLTICCLFGKDQYV